jgi:hypothetical protein
VGPLPPSGCGPTKLFRCQSTRTAPVGGS